MSLDIFGNIIGRHLAMPFANIRRVLLITTQSLSSARRQKTYHYPPQMILAESWPKPPVRSDLSLENIRNRQNRAGLTQTMQASFLFHLSRTPCPGAHPATLLPMGTYQ